MLPSHAPCWTPSGSMFRPIWPVVRSRDKRNVNSARPLAPPERLPEERLKDIERLRDQGYLNTEEYERKRAEILKEL